jgi:hypothetical protein
VTTSTSATTTTTYTPSTTTAPDTRCDHCHLCHHHHHLHAFNDDGARYSMIVDEATTLCDMGAVHTFYLVESLDTDGGAQNNLYVDELNKELHSAFDRRKQVCFIRSAFFFIYFSV